MTDDGRILLLEILAYPSFLQLMKILLAGIIGWNRDVYLDIDRAYGAAAGRSWD